MKAKFITFVRGLMNGTPPRFQSYLKSLTILLGLMLSVNVWGETYKDVVVSFTSSTKPTGWNTNGTFNTSYYKMTSGQYAETSSITTIIPSNEVLDSDFKVNVACGTFGSWSGNKNVTVTASLLDANGTSLSSGSQTYSGLNSTQGTYRGEITITKPSDVSKIAKLKIVFSNFTTGTELRFAGLKLNYTTKASAPAVVRTVTWKVNNETYTVGNPTTQVNDGEAVTTLPTAPTTDCGGKTFVGWTAIADYSHATAAPDDLFSTAADAPTVSGGNITYYAVFADGSGSGGASGSYEWDYPQSTSARAYGIEVVDGDWKFAGYAEANSTFLQLNDKKVAYVLTPECPANISSVVVTLSANAAVTMYFGSNKPTTSAYSSDVKKIETTSTNTYTIDCSSTNMKQGYIHPSATVKVTKVVVNYGVATTYSNYTTTCSTPEPDYKVTVSSNDENWGIAEINGSTILTLAEDGYRISTTNPYTIEPAGAATVTPQGTDKFLVSEVTEDCEITINFEQIPTYSVNFYINGIATPKSIQEGEKVIDYAPTTPAAFDQDFQTFVGWTISAINGIAEDKPTLITDETVTAPANYYAVFAGETLGNTYTWYKEKTLPNGNYLIAGYSNDNDYLMKNTLVSSYYIGADNQGDSYSSYEDPDETNIWKLTTTTNGTTIYNEKIEKYVELYQDGSYYDLGFSSDPCYFAITAGDEVFTIKSKKYSSYYLYFDASHSNFVAKNSSSNLYLFKQDVETTGYITTKTNRVTLHYDANAGTEVIANVPQDARINKNEKFTLPTDKLTRTGYTHLGWNESSTATEAQATITPTNDATVYAVWQVNSYTLTWELNGGTVTEEGTPDGSVEFGTTLTAPVLEKTGYTYTWSPAVPETMPASDATYSAVWKAKKTTVHFNFNLGKDAGGTAIEPDNAATQSVTATYDAAMPSIKILPQKEGKIFVGYSDKEVAKYYYNADGESQCVWDKDASSATIYAQWQDKEAVTVSFADNMHENTIPTINTYSGETFTFPAALADQTPVAGTCQGEHSHFVGWVKTSDEVTDANIHAAGSTSGTLTGSESYLAVWAKVDGDAAAFDGTKGGDFYIAVYDSHSGSEVTYYATGAVSNKKLASTTDKSEATVYTFTKGTGDNAGKFSIKTGSDYIKYSSSTDLANSYDAYWWTITAKPEGMPGSWNIQSETSGRSLDYQSYSSKGSGANYEETESHLFGGYSTSNIGANKDQYLYVEIEQVVSYTDYLTECCQGYNVTLANEGVATGGTFEANPTTACAGDVVTLTASKATGYSFSSWSVEGATPESATAETTTIQMPASDVTVNATFTPNKHNVVFTKNDGSATVSTQEVEFGVAENLNTNVFTWTNHTFNGWALSPTGNVAYEEGASFTLDEDNDVSLYAIWTADDAVAVSLFGTEHLSDITAPSSISQALTSFTFNYTVNTGYKITGVTVKVGETTLTASEVAYTATGIIITPAAGDFSAGAVSITFTVEEILYTVTLNPGSGTCAQTELTQEHYGSAVTLPTPTIAADGWAFAGWAAAKVETETESAPTLYTDTYTPAEDLTLYAVYKRGEEVESTTEKYVCDFEGTSAPTGWSFTNFSCINDDAIEPHSGSKWGKVASSSAAYVTYNTELTGKYKITAYVARTSTNDAEGPFSIKTSANNWGVTLKTVNVKNATVDQWQELSWQGDLDKVKVEIYYKSTSTAVRALDDITIVKIIEKNYYHSTPSVLTSLTVSKKLAKNTNYKVGEVFNPEGIELQAIYDNDESTAEPITEGFDYEPKTALAAGVTTITLTYKKATCTLDVTAGTLDHISITTKPSKLDYVEGECFSNASLVTRAYYKYNDAEICSEALKKDVDLTYSPSLTTPLTTSDTYVRIFYTWAGTTVYVDQPITVIGKVATPTFDPAGGKLSGETPITISCATEGASIFYTTDGTDPTTESEVYTEPVKMIGGTLKAIATAENMGQSEVGKAVFIETIDPTNGDWMLVTDVSDLAEGDYLIIASNAKGWVAGKEEGQNLAHITTTFSDDKSILTYTADAMMFRLGGETGAWTLTNVDKEHLMGATAEKKLSWDNGTTTWSITIDNSNNATIQNGSDYGRMLDNTGNYFTTYKSATSSSMLLPQLYKYYKAVPKLIYDANGGENAPVPSRAENGKAVVTDKQPTWGGYEFVNWTENQDGSGKVYTANEEVPLTANLTIYAQWQEKQLEGTPMALVVQYNGKFYAMGKDLSAVEVEGIYNGNVVVVSEEIDQKAITWYRKDVEGGVTFQNCEEKYLQGASSTNLNLVEKDNATIWNWDNDKQYYYTTVSSTVRTFFLQGTEVFKNYAVSNISSNASAATCCESFRVGEVFTRDMSNGYMGTHCYPFDIAAGDYKGAQFYEIAYRIGDTRIYFDQVDHVEAGVPYLVVPNDEENGSILEAIVTPKNEEAKSKNGFVGSYVEASLDANSGLYIVYNNEFRLAGNYVSVGANRAYIDLDNVPTNDPQQGMANAPRRISLRNSNAQAPTGIDNVVAEYGDPKVAKKVIVNGNFYIIKNDKVYGAQGQLVK